MAAIASLAGADLRVAAQLAVAMIAFQVSIGALNDVLDAASDATRKPGKPIPAGVVSLAAGRSVVVGAASLGLLLTASFGPGLVAVTGLGLAVGYGYDLIAKGTAWSWVPFAFGIPLLPVFAWFGASGGIPGSFGILLPAAVVAGSALAIANSRADLERDRAAGLESVAGRLGSTRAWLVQAALMAVVVAVALGSLWSSGAAAPALAFATCASLVIVAGIGLGGGVDPSPERRERAWEVEAVGVAALAAAWLAGMS